MLGKWPSPAKLPGTRAHKEPALDWCRVPPRLLTSINPGAKLFGVAFIAEAALLAWAATRGAAPSFRPVWNVAGVTGGVLIGYALVLYPLLGFLTGERYPAAPTFGLPCPTTIFTLGLLLWLRPRAPWSLVTIPLIWTLLGWSAAYQFGVVQDYGLGVAGIATVAVLALARRRPPVEPGARASSGADRVKGMTQEFGESSRSVT